MSIDARQGSPLTKPLPAGARLFAARRVGRSFRWLAYPYHWLAIAVLAALAVTMGVSAYPPPNYRLDIGYRDTPFVRNVSDRTIRTDLAQPRSFRWLRDGSAISITGISASYPLTISMHLSGGDRKEAVAGRLPLTVTINGHTYPSDKLTEPSHWFSWRVEPDALKSGRLDVLFNVPDQFSGILVWPQAFIADVLIITPAQPASADPDWRYILYLVAIVLLSYSFFPLARQRWLILAGLLLSGGLALGLAFLLHNDLPTFAAYAGAIALALLLIRLLVPLLGAGQPQHAARWLFLLTLAVGLLFAVPDFQSSDDALKYMVGESLLTRGTLQLPPHQLDLGSHYSRYPLGHTVAELPLLAAALGWQGLTGAPDTVRYAAVILLDVTVHTYSPRVSGFALATLKPCAVQTPNEAFFLSLAASVNSYCSTRLLPLAPLRCSSSSPVACSAWLSPPLSAWSTSSPPLPCPTRPKAGANRCSPPCCCWPSTRCCASSPHPNPPPRWGRENSPHPPQE